MLELFSKNSQEIFKEAVKASKDLEKMLNNTITKQPVIPEVLIINDSLPYMKDTIERIKLAMGLLLDLDIDAHDEPIKELLGDKTYTSLERVVRLTSAILITFIEFERMEKTNEV